MVGPVKLTLSKSIRSFSPYRCSILNWTYERPLSESPIKLKSPIKVKAGTYQTSSAVGWSVSELSASSPHLRPDSNIFSLEMDLFNPLVANLIKTGCKHRFGSL